MNIKSAFFAISMAAAPLWAGTDCNTPPLTESDSAIVGFGATHLIDPIRNDSDAEGDPLSITSISYLPGDCSGTVQILDQQLLRYTPNGQPLPGGAATCVVTYSVTDQQVTRNDTVTLIFPNEVIFADGFESGTTAAWDSDL